MKDKLLLVLLTGVLFSAVGWTVSAQIQRGPVVRQRWEYKTIKAGNGWWEEDGRPLGGNAEILLGAKLRELGEQGWEMYAVSDTIVARDGAATVPVYWFKRTY